MMMNYSATSIFLTTILKVVEAFQVDAIKRGVK